MPKDKLQVFDKVVDNIHKIPGKVGEDIQRKCYKLISANKDHKEIQSIAKVFKGKSNAQLIGMNIESAVCFKYAPVTSAEVERNSFWLLQLTALHTSSTEILFAWPFTRSIFFVEAFSNILQ
ncbi:conserved hypothetical protein [Trichinella spiralis]|uniref:hypothetical protein n=1 Tax=Trichinella spiralis TaxID=6334 RepID=UPI0001EFB294|nr:conserved hypothetical protein [Trichinella spiralis]